MQLVIIAGGKGTRLKSVTGDLPKPMVEVGGKPLLEHQILLARRYGIEDVLLLVGFGADKIREYFGDGSAWGVRIAYHCEEQPLGTAGALIDAFDRLQTEFVVMYGDTLLNVSLDRMLAAHRADVGATLFLHPNDHPHDSDLVELNEENQVQAIHHYPHSQETYLENLVNAALYVFSKKALQRFKDRWPHADRPLDICKHLFPRLLTDGVILQGYRSREYIKDAGTPERLEKVRRHYELGIVNAGSLETAVPAVFLDRDGTLNFDEGWINTPDKMSLLPGAAAAIQAINESGRLAVVVTNQPVVARGECTETQLKQIHNRLVWLLGQSHAYVDALFYCPHHPHAGFPGERAELKIDCSCRKPGAALFETAIRDLNIDKSRSWMIGDSSSDVNAALSLGIPSALVRRNQESNYDTACEPQIKTTGVLDAVRQILECLPARC